MKPYYPVIIGGGIGEPQALKECKTPLAAIKAWVRGQNPKARYNAPMDTWIQCPVVYSAKGWDRDGPDIARIREFYQWILDNEERLSNEMDKQDVYVACYLVDRAMDQARAALDSSDADIARMFDYESLSPFTGG